MSRARAFFIEEATECLRTARSELARAAPERVVVYRAVRRLRGSALLARFASLTRDAGALEALLRPGRGADGWPESLVERVRTGLDALELDLARVRAGELNPQEETKAPMDGEVRRTEGVVRIEELEYRGRAALERAAELRDAIEDAVVSEAPVGPILDELFDLIRLGMT